MIRDWRNWFGLKCWLRLCPFHPPPVRSAYAKPRISAQSPAGDCPLKATCTHPGCERVVYLSWLP